MCKIQQIILLLTAALCFWCCTEKPIDDIVLPDEGKDSVVVCPIDGSSLYGTVSNLGKPLAGVVVSDGVSCVQTDSNGIYQLHSAKRNGLVYISLPSGYAVKSAGTVPGFFKQTAKAAAEAERIDFELFKDVDQTNHTMLVFGDIHLFNDSSVKGFAKFRDEINILSGSGVWPCPYAMTLGDMSWDYYWYSTPFGLNDYLSQMNGITGLQVFNTVGNHDHDMMIDSKTEYEATGEDFSCQDSYRRLLGPTCYSFNIGGIHYMSIDNVITTDDGTGKDGRGHRRAITKTDMEWIRQDLSFVSKDTPIVVGMHIPLFNSKGGDYSSKIAEYTSITSLFQGYDVTFMSAHTHSLYNHVVQNNGQKVVEWNTGAVCGDFWGSYKKHGINLCINGSPGGYRILTVSGKAMDSEYKATGFEGHHFFRSYDRNTMDFSAAIMCPKAPEGSKQQKYWTNRTASYAGPSEENHVYIHVWDMKDGWTLTVTENGTVLPTEKVEEHDPLFLAANIAGQCNSNKENWSIGTTSDACRQMYRVTAGSATSTLIISVTDTQGNTHTETMTRPKIFSIKKYTK
jgi:hypothetical protein